MASRRSIAAIGRPGQQVIGPVPHDPRYEHCAGRAALSGVIVPDAFGDRDPGLVRGDGAGAEVAERGATLGDQDPLGGANHPQPGRIDLGDEQRSAVPHDVVVVGAAAGVGEKQALAPVFRCGSSDYRPALGTRPCAVLGCWFKSPRPDFLRHRWKK